MPAAERIGKYEIVQHLATGGMGQVYLAKTIGPGGFARHCVIKTLDAISVEGDDVVAMFLDEARLVGSLHHQHIAQVVEVDRDDTGRYFLVMEYVHGETAERAFTAAVMADKALPLEFGLSVVLALAAALHYAHERHNAAGQSLGIVHRDVSPSNVMVGFDGGVKLIDFGIARNIDRTTRTQIGFVKGKLGYMAPEQLLEKPLDRRTDVFALGIVLYELTTTARAFHAATELEMMQRLRDGVYRPPTQVLRGYPQELALVIARALAVDPERRFATAAEVGTALAALAARLGIRTGEAPIALTMKDLFGAPTEPWLIEPASDKGTRRDTERDAGVIAAPPKKASVAVERAQALPAPIDPEALVEGPIEDLLKAVRGEDLAALWKLLPAAPRDPRSTERPAAPPSATGPEHARSNGRPPALPLAAEAGGREQARSTERPPALATVEAIGPTHEASQAEARRQSWWWPPTRTTAIIAVVGVFAMVLVGLWQGEAWLFAPGAPGVSAPSAVAPSAAAPSAAAPSAAAGAPASAEPKPVASTADASGAIAPTLDAGTPAAAMSPDASANGATVTLRISTQPSDATVLVDGVRIGRSPLTHRVETGPHSVKIRRRGHTTRRLQLQVTEDVDLVVPLKPQQGANPEDPED